MCYNAYINQHTVPVVSPIEVQRLFGWRKCVERGLPCMPLILSDDNVDGIVDSITIEGD